MTTFSSSIRYAAAPLAFLSLAACMRDPVRVGTGIPPVYEIPVPVRDSTGSIAATDVVLPAGTPVRLTPSQAVSGARAATGTPVAFQVIGNVEVNRAVVIALESVSATDGQTVPLRDTVTESGRAVGKELAVLSLLVNPLVLLGRGSDIHYLPGAVFEAHTAEPRSVRAWSSVTLAKPDSAAREAVGVASIRFTRPSVARLGTTSALSAISLGMAGFMTGAVIDERKCERAGAGTFLFDCAFSYDDASMTGWTAGSVVGSAIGAALRARQRGCPARKAWPAALLGAAIGALPAIIVTADRPDKFPPSRTVLLLAAPLSSAVGATFAVRKCAV